MHPLKAIIETRASTNLYDATRPVSDREIQDLVALATRAPSAYNFQNWKFIAVRSHDAKLRLKSVSFGQQKVADAAVTFIICGTLAAHERLPWALQPSIDSGILGQSVLDEWVAMAERSHIGNPQLQRDEAIRSASLAAMILMLAAHSMGFATGSMSGFDPRALSQEFGLAATEVPVILVTVGYPAPGNWPQKPRRPASEFLEYV